MKVQWTKPWTKPSYPLTVTCIFYLTGWILDRKFSTYLVHTFTIFCCLHIWKKNYFIHEMIHLLNLNKKTNRLPQDTHWTYRVTHMYLNDFLKMGVASKWAKPCLQNFLCFLSIIMANFSENLVTIASIFPLSMALLD